MVFLSTERRQVNLETNQLIYLRGLVAGTVPNRPDASDFTGQDVIVLGQMLDQEIASRSGVGIPPDWREQAAAFVASGRLNTIAPSKALRNLADHKSRVEGNRLAALAPEDLLSELGI